MSSALDDLHPILGHTVDDTVLIVDAAAPETAEVAPQRLRLADPVVSVALDVLQELVDPLQDLLVPGLPVQVILSRVLGE